MSSATLQVTSLAEITEIARGVIRDSNLPPQYSKRLDFELAEITKQASDQYWVNLVNSGTKFSSNPNHLLLPWLLDLCPDDPIAASTNGDLVYTTSYSQMVEYIKKHGKLPPGIKRDDDKPDIDIDCLPYARDEIKAYAAKEYSGDSTDGIGSVANVVTWSSYLFKQALQDVAMATGQCTKAEAAAVTKILPDDVDDLKENGQSTCKGKIKDSVTGVETDCGTKHMDVKCHKCGSTDTENPTIGQLLNEHDDLKLFATKYPDVVGNALRLVGKLRHMGKHAGALIIADRPLYGNIPLTKKAGDDEQWMAIWSEGRSPQLSKFGYTKWDILGLKTLEYIFECCKLIERNHGISFGHNMAGLEDIDPEIDQRGWYLTKEGKKVKISLNDPAALDLANGLFTDAVFQFDTELAKRTLSHGVRSFYDLLIFNAMGHPGPMAMIPDYAERRDDHQQTWKRKENPKITEVIGETFNTIVYQEQLQALWQRVAGFTSPEAQEARKAVAKKWREKLKPIKEKWIRGASPILGVQGAHDWWDKMESFGRYAFNKSHAVSYCLVAYICLWLKAHFAAEWWTTVMSFCNRDKLVRYMNAARSEGIKIAPTDVCRLAMRFETAGGKPGKKKITEGGEVTPGLLGIKNVGLSAEKFAHIQQYETIEEFIAINGKNKTVLERLIKLGAFRNLPGHANSRALWMWYQYEYGSGPERKPLVDDILMRLFKAQGWTMAKIAEERARQAAEFKAIYPKRSKIPTKIENWTPKLDTSRATIMELFPDDYSIVEQIAFEEEYLGYTIKSPLEMYKTRGDRTIARAKEHGMLEVIIVKKEYTQTKTDKTMCRLTVFDGIQQASLILWEDDIARQDKLLCRKGAAITVLANYSPKFGSFSLTRSAKLMPLQPKDELRGNLTTVSD